MRDNLILRGNTYHVRLAIPEDVRSFFGGRKLLSKSLGTGLQQEAKDKARPILLLWKQQIGKARQEKASKADAWREEAFLSSEAIKNSLQDWTLSLAGISPIRTVSDEEKERIKATLQEVKEPFTPHPTIPGISVDLRGKNLSEQIEQIQALSVWARNVEKERLQWAYTIKNDQRQELAAILADPKAYKPKSPITRQMLDNWATHLETQIKTAKTRDRNKQAVQALSQYLSQEGAHLNFDTVHSWLCTLPPARTTRANYLWACRSFWKWANKYNSTFREQFHNQPCPFDGHELPKTGEAAGQKRLAFSKQEIERLYGIAAKNDTVLANLIKFGAYTGARIEEIGRIRPEDTIFDANGEPIGFKVIKSKTDAGIRDVPLHPDLVPLFKELSANASANDGYLFAGGKNKYLNRLDYLSKRFGRLKTTEGFGKNHAFHSLRHSFTTLLHQKGVSIEVLPFLTGHETGNFTLSVYSKGPSFKMKQDAISLLYFDFINASVD